jgi:hypothetical protein
MYALTQSKAGHFFLEVVVGGIAMENLIVPLTEDEEAAYKSNGKSELDNLACEICKEPDLFRSRGERK